MADVLQPQPVKTTASDFVLKRGWLSSFPGEASKSVDPTDYKQSRKKNPKLKIYAIL